MNWFKRFGRFTGTDWFFFALCSASSSYIIALTVGSVLYHAPLLLTLFLAALALASVVVVVKTVIFVTN
jgi:hypothetical protein